MECKKSDVVKKNLLKGKGDCMRSEAVSETNATSDKVHKVVTLGKGVEGLSSANDVHH